MTHAALKEWRMVVVGLQANNDDEDKTLRVVHVVLLNETKHRRLVN